MNCTFLPRGSRALLLLLAVAASVTAVLPNSARAWTYPEHRDIAVLAVQGLDAERRAVFDSLWQDARTSVESRFCASGAEAGQGVTPTCIDWSALPAIAGDHSCSSAEMLTTVRESDWILAVADVAAQLKIDLAAIPVVAPPESTGTAASAVGDARRRITDESSRARRVNALRTSDTRLQRADAQYATRAGANLAHFLFPRPDTSLDPLAYGQLTFKSGRDLNAVGVYTWYHVSAMQKARRLADPALSVQEKRDLARAALFDEAFALHFLEDVFAAGHLAGSWGDVSQRKGTHDFYNQNGLEVFTWKGRDHTVVLMGDAHMRPEDAALAANTVRDSLAQVLDVVAGRAPELASIPTAGVTPQAEDFDVCKNLTFPDRADRLGTGLKNYTASLESVLLSTPVPGLGPGLGSQPRARSEVGAFVGLASSIEGRAITGGFEQTEDKGGWVGGLDLGVRAGVGLEGALGDAGDGLLFAQLGIHSDAPSTNEYPHPLVPAVNGRFAAAIPSRTGLSMRLRMPFYLVPGDLLLLAPMYFINPEKYTELAVTASNGGAFGLERGYATGIGRFQFVLGRELGVTWYGLTGNQQFLVPPEQPGQIGRILNIKSVYFDAPLLEYRPYRAFSANQSTAIVFQLFAGADVPYDSEVVLPESAAKADLQTVWSLGLRMAFDWRYYW